MSFILYLYIYKKKRINIISMHDLSGFIYCTFIFNARLTKIKHMVWHVDSYEDFKRKKTIIIKLIFYKVRSVPLASSPIVSLIRYESDIELVSVDSEVIKVKMLGEDNNTSLPKQHFLWYIICNKNCR